MRSAAGKAIPRPGAEAGSEYGLDGSGRAAKTFSEPVPVDRGPPRNAHHATSGVEASSRRTSASAVSVAGSAAVTGTASTIRSTWSCESTMMCVA
jgi:hypothetical protein